LEKGVRRVEMELKEVLKAWRSATNERGVKGYKYPNPRILLLLCRIQATR
jgi:hypothetical protein